MSTLETVQSLFNELYSDIRAEDQFNVRKPLLAHYTSLDVLEKVVTNNEIWFSNPLLMNDLEELKFGVLGGVRAAKNSQSIRVALGSEARHQAFLSSLDFYLQEFDENHVFDTYVFCASEHDPDNTDGILSMWRGYGNNGNGVAIIFDAEKLDLATPPTPLVLAKVHYATTQDREKYLEGYCDLTAQIISRNQIPDNLVYLVSYSLFDRIKLFALFTKHKGFEEEQEWRAVYRREFDRYNKYSHLFGYNLGGAGVEPKLKFKVAPIVGVTADDLSLEKIVWRILLGPTTSSLLALKSVKRMLTLLNKQQLADRVEASTIPLRSK